MRFFWSIFSSYKSLRLFSPKTVIVSWFLSGHRWNWCFRSDMTEPLYAALMCLVRKSTLKLSVAPVIGHVLKTRACDLLSISFCSFQLWHSTSSPVITKSIPAKLVAMEILIGLKDGHRGHYNLSYSLSFSILSDASSWKVNIVLWGPKKKNKLKSEETF